MVVERRRLFPRLDHLIESQHSADLHTWDLLLGSVVAGFVVLGLGKDAEKGRVTICGPVPESETANKNCHASEDRVEEIEGSNSRDANEIKQRALYA
jgi:hypothetical protein